MQFTDLSFWALFIAFLAIFAVLRNTAWLRCLQRNAVLLYVIAFSLVFFYMANGWFMILLPATALVTWGLVKIMSEEKRNDQRKFLLGFAIVLDLLPLIYFKYSNFYIIGISFFTFQAISYAVDVYRGKFTEKVTLIEYLFYLSFFPLLLAGPITRAGHFFPQIRVVKNVSSRLLYLGVWLVMLGMIKKCVFADYLAQYNNWIFDSPMTYSGFECMMGILGYTVQIYCDFSGYSDLSIGIAAMMGIRLRDNFNFPYRSTSVTEFWRRWHISLSTWFRDYFYIPLGGNRRGKFRTYLNNFLTMVLAGVWHGATWMFVLWGAIHGLGLVVNKLCKGVFPSVHSNWLTKSFSWLLTFVYVTIAWVFFRATSVENACLVLSRSVTDFDIAYFTYFIEARPWWCVFLIIPMLCMLIGERRFVRLQTRFIMMPWIVKLLLFTLAVQVVIQFHTSSVQPFIYYQF